MQQSKWPHQLLAQMRCPLWQLHVLYGLYSTAKLKMHAYLQPQVWEVCMPVQRSLQLATARSACNKCVPALHAELQPNFLGLGHDLGGLLQQQVLLSAAVCVQAVQQCM